MNIRSANEIAKEKLDAILVVLSLGYSNNSYGIPGNSKEYFILSHFEHQIKDIPKYLYIYPVDKIIVWSESFILNAKHSVIRETISNFITDNNIEQLVPDEFIQFMEKPFAEIDNDNRNLIMIDYYNQNKNKFPEIEDILAGQDINLGNKSEPDMIKYSLILSTFIAQEIKKCEKTHTNKYGHVTKDIEGFDKNIIASNALKAFKNITPCSVMTGIRLMIGLVNAINLYLDENETINNCISLFEAKIFADLKKEYNQS